MEVNEIKAKLKKFICDELIRKPDYPLEDDEHMISGGLIDSFSLAYIGVFIEGEFGVYIPDNDLTVENMDTLNQMADRIQKP
jgi:acyl carrier protein